MTFSPEFTLRAWLVTVVGYGAATIVARSRGAALAQAWASDAFSSMKFRDFLVIASCRKAASPSEQFGDPIKVAGRRAFFVDRDRATVRFCEPGADFALPCHPLDVEPAHYRPEAYRQAAGE